MTSVPKPQPNVKDSAARFQPSAFSAQLFGVIFVKNLSAVSQLPKLTIPSTAITPVWESQKPDQGKVP